MPFETDLSRSFGKRRRVLRPEQENDFLTILLSILFLTGFRSSSFLYAHFEPS